MAEEKLFISGLSYGIDENLLAEAFSQYGTIKKVNLIRDRHTKNSCGFGFIQYANVKCAKLAMEAMEGNTLAGRTIRVEQARRHGRSGRGVGRGRM
uniref:RRM domain-containing protein n=1 Tax=Neogobius melanostomus TaxID=47308 RepID=A0A8C6S6X4_9GOBI